MDPLFALMAPLRTPYGPSCVSTTLNTHRREMLVDYEHAHTREREREKERESERESELLVDYEYAR